MNDLGRLERVHIRDIWKSEAQDFTPWLAQEENISLLGETVNLDLEVESTEKEVGPFRADILCKDTATDQYVLIENQLERTDHTHLGQLMTYAAGLHAVSIVWISQRFTEEHRATLDWLNDITDESINFFGLEVELWKIGDSNIAPKFNVVSKPNDWSRTVTTAARSIESSEMTETKKLQYDYWKAFREYMEAHDGRVGSRKPRAQHWMVYGVGRTKFSLGTVVNTRDRNIGLWLAIKGRNAKTHFHSLADERAAIERELNEVLDWRELPNKKESRIELRREDFDPTDCDSWPQQHAWMFERLEAFYRVFHDRVRNLNADDYEEEVVDE